MNKTDLIAAVSAGAGITKKDAAAAVDATLAAITKALAEGDNVQLIGFGTFSVRERNERIGTNPHTGEQMTVAASKAAAFKAGKVLKDSINA